MNSEYQRLIQIADDASEKFCDEATRKRDSEMLLRGSPEITQLYVDALYATEDFSEEEIEACDSFSAFIHYRFNWFIRDSKFRDHENGNKVIPFRMLKSFIDEDNRVYDYAIQKNSRNVARFQQEKEISISMIYDEFSEAGAVVKSEKGNAKYKRLIQLALDATDKFYDEAKKKNDPEMLRRGSPEITQLYVDALYATEDFSEEEIEANDYFSTFIQCRFINSFHLTSQVRYSKVVSTQMLKPFYDEIEAVFDYETKKNSRNTKRFLKEKELSLSGFEKMLSEAGITIRDDGHSGAGAPAPKEGCYIATSIYGSYDCPQVWVLRRYRDNALRDNILGRLFIRFYYFVSPVMVRRFGDKKWFSFLFRKPLDKLVKKLQYKGYEDTPYNDETQRG